MRTLGRAAALGREFASEASRPTESSRVPRRECRDPRKLKVTDNNGYRTGREHLSEDVFSREPKKRSFRVTILSLGRELCLGQSLSAEGHRPLREHATIHIKKQVPPYLARLKIDPVELCTHCRLGMSRLCSIYILRVMEQLVERNFPHSQNNCKFYFHLARALTKLSV